MSNCNGELLTDKGMNKEIEKNYVQHHIERLRELQEQGLNVIGGFPIAHFILSLETYKDAISFFEPYVCNSLINHLVSTIKVGKADEMDYQTLFDLLHNVASHFYSLGIADERREIMELREQAMQRFNPKGIDMDYPIAVDECFKKE